MENDYTNIIIILIGLMFILLGFANKINKQKENNVKSKDIKKQIKKNKKEPSKY